ncbi:hypothetical protein F2P81_024033 [Scophthalmus maximus]|uniref:Uncharacterized protein n=1 Tax=Scophthalmus maximus TaxID=52904 RepID=A0A6A4RNH4_SCOMX|nr:hypothetical protein F2P81_024033 [Scophthalmus maximus]
MNQLNVTGRNTDILLRTMGQENHVNSYKITGLQKAKERVTNTKPADKPTDEQQGLSVDDLDEAEKSVIRYEQQRYFASELTLLRKGKPVRTDSSIRKLDPILDDRIIRIGGRISKSALPTSLKNLIILPKDSHVSQLIMRDIHQQVGHRKKPYALQTRPEVLVTLFQLSKLRFAARRDSTLDHRYD